jgi:ubiquinone/menaquinone biosynthesis C-methylase UbiE
MSESSKTVPVPKEGGGAGYDKIYHHAHPDEERRLDLLSALFDQASRRVLTSVGVATGWRCLDIGAGAGSITRWLATTVRPGEVTAVDLDTGFLERDRPSNVRVVRVDAFDPKFAPGPVFDLVHTRFVLMHLPRRDELLDRMASWVRPGGWLVTQEAVDFSSDSTPRPYFRRALEAFWTVLRSSVGTDIRWARTLPAPLLDRGFTDVGMAVEQPVLRGRGALAEFYKLSLTRLEDEVVRAGLVTSHNLARFYADLDDPTVWDLSASMISAWGRRPAP